MDGSRGGSEKLKLLGHRGLVDFAEDTLHGDGLRLSAREAYGMIGVLCCRSYLERSETKYKRVHPRPSQASIHAPKGITPRVCGCSMIGNARGAVERAVSIGEDGPHEV